MTGIPTYSEAETTTVYAALTETTDAPASTSTSYRMSVGDTFSGTIGSTGDEDWVRVYLQAGHSYVIDEQGSPSGVGTLSDPYLHLYNSSGNQIAYNDDGGDGLESQITITVSESGYYYIGASAYGSSTGSYLVSVTEAAAPDAPASLDTLADYLVNGYWQDNGSTARRFDTSSSNVITVDIHNLTAAGQQLARWALDAWASVADVVFVETTGTAMIEFDDADTGAYSTSSYSGGFITSSSVNIGLDWLNSYGTTIDSYSFQSYVHEIGHALGLGHQGDYNGSATYGVDETFSNDSWQVSIMSYFSQTDNTSIIASEAFDVTPMMADIIAIQSMYGASDGNAGNTTYFGNSNVSGYMSEVYAAIATGTTNSDIGSNDVALTIYDSGGRDTIDVSFSSANQVLNLNPTRYSDIDGLIGNLGIARGTVIENGITGSGDDRIIGNGARNLLNAGSGNDYIAGGNGSDTLLGGNGDDTLVGGNGDDSLRGGNGSDVLSDVDGSNRFDGGAGSDTMTGGAGDDVMIGGGDDATSGDRSDRISGEDGSDSIVGGYGNDVIRGGNDNDTIYGGLGKDRIFGDSGNDRLYGGTNTDVINGGAGNDIIYGQSGNDSLTGGSGADRFVHSGLASDGTDWITDYSGAQHDVLILRTGNINDIQVEWVNNGGDAGVLDANIVNGATGDVLWCVLDAADQDHLYLNVGSTTYDLAL
ncbi:MAG: M10 family metallopeptidase [Paenirhodobacter sp.]|uniref:M10 family metallopeptidase n=1 Tax=Paenirhodobacter sp. TaxID=1965326 RepID=UPI003D0A6957